MPLRFVERALQGLAVSVSLRIEPDSGSDDAERFAVLVDRFSERSKLLSQFITRRSVGRRVAQWSRRVYDQLPEAA
jgi:hypothetical protein